MVGALTSITILMAIAALHAYWASGGLVGKGIAIPERDGKPVLTPGAAITYAVAACLALAALIIAMRVGFMPSWAAGPVLHVATWALVAVFALRAVGDFRYVGFFKRVRGTRFSRLDTMIYSPLCCLLAILIADAARM